MLLAPPPLPIPLAPPSPLPRPFLTARCPRDGCALYTTSCCPSPERCGAQKCHITCPNPNASDVLDRPPPSPSVLVPCWPAASASEHPTHTLLPLPSAHPTSLSKFGLASLECSPFVEHTRGPFCRSHRVTPVTPARCRKSCSCDHTPAARSCEYSRLES